MEEAGMADFEHTLTSIDDDWRKNTAMQLQLNCGRRIHEKRNSTGSTFWNNWAKYVYSSTNWNHRLSNTFGDWRIIR